MAASNNPISLAPYEKIAEVCGQRVAKEVYEHREQSRQASKSASGKELMAKVIEQGYCCATCGIDLAPEDSRLDHIVPVSKGGTDKVINLQWLCCGCNNAKGDMDLSAFIALCQRVTNWQSTPGLSGPSA